MDGRTDPPAQVSALPAVDRRARRQPWLWLVGTAVMAGVAWFVFGQTRPAKPAAAGGGAQAGAAQPVSVASVARGTIRVILNGLGAVTPLATVTVQTQINGTITAIGYTEGQIVHRGDFLLQIDPRPYQVALEQAQGALARDQALLAQARTDAARYQGLVRVNSIARQQAEDQVFLAKQYLGTVQVDQAAVDSARLNLDYCRVTSPIDGRVGLRQVDIGNYVTSGQTGGLVVVTQLQPISVVFNLPEDDIPQISAAMAKGALSVVAYDRSNTVKLATGHLATLDTQIDNTTGTVKMRALFDNADGALFPQQFVNVQLIVSVLSNVLTAPGAAVQQGAPGAYVYRVDAQNIVHVAPVAIGPADGDQVQIVSGLASGDRIVVDGMDRLRDGAAVNVPGSGGARGAAAPGGHGQHAGWHHHAAQGGDGANG